MDTKKMWVDMIVELQSLAQAGLAYGKDAYDKERYERIREISAEMMSHIADIPLEKVKGLFCNEIGYQTPKIDTRAAIFKDDKILLVQEKNGTWSLPGGWCDVTVSVAENTIKEVKEEAGLDVIVKSVIAIQEKSIICPCMLIGFARYLCCALRLAEILNRILRRLALLTSQRTKFRSSPLKRIMKNKSKCVLLPTVQEKNGKHYLTSYNHRLSRQL